MQQALLYHTPMNCSLAVRMAAEEAGVPLALEHVDFETKALASGGSLRDVNSLGQVSTLRLPDGELLTETTACLLWVQSQNDTAFRVPHDDPEYFQLLRWLSFVATELHKQALRVVFYPEATDNVKDRFRALVPDRLAVLDAHLADRSFLLMRGVSAADVYLGWFFLLAGRAGISTRGFGHVEAYVSRVHNRPAVARVIQDDAG